MVTQWMILLSLASLALGVRALRGDGEVEEEKNGITVKQNEKFSFPMECCDYEKVLPNMFTTDRNHCAGAIVNSLEFGGEGRTECATKCAFSEHGLLNEDESVKESELRKLFMDQADHDAKAVLQKALDECFGELKDDSSEDEACPSGADIQFICILNVIAVGCPERLWYAGKGKCEATRDKYWKVMFDTLVT